MKKLISLAVVLSLVLCMAAAAFATEPELGSIENPIVVSDPSEMASVDIPAGTILWFSLPAEWSGMILTFSAPMSGPAIYGYMYGMQWEESAGFMSASCTLDGWDRIMIGLGSAFGYDIYGGACEIVEPVVGSQNKPQVLDSVDGPITVNCIETNEGPAYFMTWTNFGDGGNLVLNGVTGNFDVVELNWVGYYSDSTAPISVGVAPYDTVTITVRGQDLDDIVLDLSLEPFEEGASEYTPFEIEDQDKDYTFEAVLNENGSEVFYKLYDVQGAIITINNPNAIINGYGDGWVEVLEEDSNVVSVKVGTFGEEQSIVIGIASSDENDTGFTVNVSEPAGYDENPVKLDKLDSISAEIEGGLADTFYYIWNAPSAGKVTLGITGAEWFGDALYMAATQWQEYYDDDGEYLGADPIAWDDVKPQLTIFVNGVEVMAGTEVMFDVKADDVVIIAVKSLPIYEYETYGYSAYVDVAGNFDAVGSMNNPIVVNDPSELGGIDVPAGEQVYIAISSMLNGQVLTIVGDANTSVATRAGAVAGNNGLFVVELNGVPANMIVVENKGTADASYIAEIAYPKGSEQNPIVVNDPSELGGIDVAAGQKVYIAISSMLNGQVLTIVGDANTAVMTRAGAVTGNNGLFTVELNGVPANMVVVENLGTTDASYIATIEYPAGSEQNPIILGAMGGATTAEAAAGSTTYYLVNGAYNGNYILVKGEGLTVTVNGTAVEAVDGKYYVQLNGVPVNAIVIANSSAAAVSYSINIVTDNPATGDSGVLVAVAAAIVALTGAVAMVAKKKD